MTAAENLSRWCRLDATLIEHPAIDTKPHGYHESLEPSCRAGVRSFAEGSSFGTAEAEERRMTRGTDADGVAETEAVAARCSERLPQRPKLDAIAVRVTFVCGVHVERLRSKLLGPR